MTRRQQEIMVRLSDAELARLDEHRGVLVQSGELGRLSVLILERAAVADSEVTTTGAILPTYLPGQTGREGQAFSRPR
jgi:hypothetical protein